MLLAKCGVHESDGWVNGGKSGVCWFVEKLSCIGTIDVEQTVDREACVGLYHGAILCPDKFVVSASKQKERGAKAIDIAKSLLDYGFYAPTIYFPTNIPESIMIEPTESEDKNTLDRFIDAMLEIDVNIDKDIDKIINGPFKTPVSRLDETKANRELDLSWKKSEV